MFSFCGIDSSLYLPQRLTIGSVREKQYRFMEDGDKGEQRQGLLLLYWTLEPIPSSWVILILFQTNVFFRWLSVSRDFQNRFLNIPAIVQKEISQSLEQYLLHYLQTPHHTSKEIGLLLFDELSKLIKAHISLHFLINSLYTFPISIMVIVFSMDLGF